MSAPATAVWTATENTVRCARSRDRASVRSDPTKSRCKGPTWMAGDEKADRHSDDHNVSAAAPKIERSTGNRRDPASNAADAAATATTIRGPKVAATLFAVTQSRWSSFSTMRPSKPFTKRPESSVEKDLANSTASDRKS